MPRFVILEHDHPFLHWDLMLEAGPVLRTWRLASPPEGGTQAEAEPLPDHRLAYLDYEGPVSGGRGRVLQWDKGTYWSSVDREQQLMMELNGKRVRGQLWKAREEEERWFVRWEAPGHPR